MDELVYDKKYRIVNVSDIDTGNTKKMPEKNMSAVYMVRWAGKGYCVYLDNVNYEIDHSGMRTSMADNIFVGDGWMEITTMNSLYYLEEVK